MVEDLIGKRRAAWPIALRWPRSTGGAIAAAFVEERERWILWLPVVFGLGIMVYFALLIEPPIWLGGVVAALGLAGAWVLRGRPVLAAVLLLTGIAAAGFGIAQFKTWRVTAPVLQRQTGPGRVAGRIVDLDTLVDGTRIVLEPTEIQRLDPAALPRRVRVHLRPGAGPLAIGDRVEVTATLFPPPAPALPGGFDFQRQAFFAQLGGVGYAVGMPRVLPASEGGSASPGFWINRLRAAMTERLEAALPGDAGGIAAALITGERGAIPAAVNQDFRDSGLAHILVIAGLHMTLVTGIAFFGIRAGLALIPWVALRFPLKKAAAAAALAVACFYLLISGASVPAERAFVMCALGLVAILIDRLHISLFGVAWAAWAVLLVSPEALVGVGFQMSFAAVVALIAFYETYGRRLAGLRQGAGPIGRLLLYVAGVSTTTVIATLGTAAFAIYHFNRFSLFSILANVVAVPISGFWVMPWGMIGCALMPFGLEAWGLAPMRWGIALVVWIAHWTAGLPSAVLQVPAMPIGGLIAIALGGLWLSIWRQSWRRWGFVPIGLGMASMALTQPPDLLIAGDGKLIAVRGASGGYLVSDMKADRIVREAWAQRALGVPNQPWPSPSAPAGPSVSTGPSGDAADPDLRCDEIGCVYRHAGHVVALPLSAAALAEDCRSADLVVTALAVRAPCRGQATVIDRWDAWRYGTHAVWLGRTITIQTADELRGTRPWVPRRPEKWPDSSPNPASPANPAAQ
ncbi:MAG TPA: ComEC/Rec2 family competence protein [Stellaceae bacterium]|nr:ComEC/Rec2 family competence protein [Stellaceae bacterium]